MHWVEGISVPSILWDVSADPHTWVFSSEITFNKLLSLENKQSGQCMVHLEHWENKQPRICFLPVFTALFGMCIPDISPSSPKKKVLFKIKLFIWHFWAALFWRATAMGGFGAHLRRNQFILLLLFLLQIQSLGLDIDSRPTTEVCATHIVSPGPKGEERKMKRSYLVSKLSYFISQPHSSPQWLSLLPSLEFSHFPSILEKSMSCYLF